MKTWCLVLVAALAMPAAADKIEPYATPCEFWGAVISLDDVARDATASPGTRRLATEAAYLARQGFHLGYERGLREGVDLASRARRADQ